MYMREALHQAEAAAEIGVLGQVTVQDLYRYQPVQPVEEL